MGCPMFRRFCETWESRTVPALAPPASCHCEGRREPAQCLVNGRLKADCAIIDCGDSIDCMASITIRNLEEKTKRRLKIRAAMNGRSMEHEVREIIKNALRQPNVDRPKTGAELAESIHRRFARLGGVELEPLPKEFMTDPDWLKDRKT